MLRAQKFQKITISRDPHFKSIPRNFIPNITIFCMELNLEGMMNFSFQNL